MRIIAVDNNQRDLNALRKAALEAFPSGTVTGFTDPLMAIKHCMEHPPDVVLSERDLKRMDGFALIKTLRQRFPLFQAALLSPDESWRHDAENLMLGFIEKPVTAEKLGEWISQTEEEQV